VYQRYRAPTRARRGAPWSEEDDKTLLELRSLAPRLIAERLGRSWLACKRRLAYLLTGLPEDRHC
jgi:hypothetical protein